MILTRLQFQFRINCAPDQHGYLVNVSSDTAFDLTCQEIDRTIEDNDWEFRNLDWRYEVTIPRNNLVFVTFAEPETAEQVFTCNPNFDVCVLKVSFSD